MKAYRSGELLAIKFKDKKDVCMLTTLHDETLVDRPDRRHRNQRQTKPACTDDYNKFMGGVDRADQLIKPYEIPRKSLKWYKKLAMHFLQLATLNSFLLYKKDGGRKVFLDFQREVIDTLIFGSGDDGIHTEKEENVARHTERHIITPIPESETKQKPQKSLLQE